jgi:RNA polymerase sigma factor (sigma-70 family)
MIAVVDDDPSVREALSALIRSAGWSVEAFDSADAFLVRLNDIDASCAILDVRLQESNGLALQQRMTERGVATPIVFITGHGDIPTSVRAMKAGAMEFLTKPFVDQDILDGVEPAIERYRIARDEREELDEIKNCFASLTERERQVMALVIAGRLNKQTARELGIKEITVKVHRSRVMAKMKASSLPDLVTRAARLRAGESRVPH